MGAIFVRRRDGRIQVRLTDEGRTFVGAQFDRLRAAEDDDKWRPLLQLPIDPRRDDDDPLRSLQRQEAIVSNAEMASLTVHHEFLSEGEAWAWMSSLQLCLRTVATLAGVVTPDDVATRTHEELSEILGLQQLLFDLASALA